MKKLEQTELLVILKAQRIRPRIVKNVRYSPAAELDWNALDIYAVPARSGTEGVLLIDVDGLFVLPYELTTKTQDNATGRSKPTTCDFCFTWQSGSNSGRITFTRISDGHTFTYICCADLKCSLHVRNLTTEGQLSRTQLREDLTTDQRVERLRNKLRKILATLDAKPMII